jgi:hypothetical protein
MTEDTLWQDEIGNSPYTAKVIRNGDSVFRGILMIYEGEELRFQKEVPIAHGAVFGADKQVAQAWSRIIYDWIRNKS